MATAVLTRQITIAGTGYAGAFSKTLNILPGTLSIQDMDDHRGGTMGLPRVKVAVGAKVTFQALVNAETSTNYSTVAQYAGYVSVIGEGSATCTDATLSAILARNALVDIRITGKAVQVAEVEIKGTNW